MIDPEKNIIRTVLYPLIFLCVLTLFITLFALRETRRAATLSSDSMMVEQVLKVSGEALINQDIFTINRNIQSLIGDRIKLRFIFDDGYELYFPKDYFADIWHSVPTFEVKHITKTGKTIRAQVWSSEMQEPWGIYGLYLALLLIGSAVFVYSARNIRRWESDLNATARFLFQKESESVLPALNFGFFGEVIALAKKSMAHEKDLIEKENQLRVADSIATLAAQVAHDIRSPLAALGAAEKGLGALPEEERVLIRAAVARIRDIAQQLLNKNKQLQQEQLQQTKPNKEAAPAEPFSVEQVQVLIEQILGEKRMQYRDRRDLELLGSWSEEAYPLLARVQPVEFQRLLSNLINNAIEALPSTRLGRVSVSLQPGPENSITISVADNGNGIPPEVLPRLMKKGATFGKEGGSGLGLHHAQVTAERWKGQLRIESGSGKGTTVILNLPCAEPPPWFVGELCLPPASWIIALDDDASVHEVWKRRFQGLGVNSQKITVCHFKAPGELVNWVNQNLMIWDQALYLVDHDLSDSKRTGLDVIQELGIQPLSVLVTSRAVEGAIRERCEKIGVKLIPKELAASVPMRLVVPAATAQAS